MKEVAACMGHIYPTMYSVCLGKRTVKELAQQLCYRVSGVHLSY